MASGLDYYAILGIEPTLDAAVIEQAYRSRSLPFRVGQLRRRTDEVSGPTQEQVEEAYHILSNPQSRLLYYQARFPNRPPPKPARRRYPIWLWAVIAVWLAVIVGVVSFGIRSRITTDGGAIGQIVQTPTVVAAASGVRSTQAGGGTVSTSGGASTGGSATSSASTSGSTAGTPQASATSATSPAGAGATGSPLAGRSTATTGAANTAAAATTTRGGASAGASATSAPAATAPPTATATALPPTATPVPPVAVVPTEPPPTEPPPPPAPTPMTGPPPFAATDRIGTALSVNLRNGPGPNYPSLGLLPTGTLLRATGETAYSGGQLWRRFVLQDGRRGWVRDLDVFPAR